MYGTVSYNEKGDAEQPKSAYQPSSEIRDLTTYCKKSYEDGNEILHRSFPEFNNRSVIDRMNEDQKAWLGWTPEPDPDPEASWRWNGVRPMTRAKVIGMAAHLTSQLIYPNVFAQNEADEEDKDMAYVMKDLIEYNIRHSDYETSFLYGVVSGLVNPVTYWEVGYTEAYQNIIDGTQSNFTKKRVMDEVLSGFQNHLHNSNEILISNPYQFDLQKQKCLIKKRLISQDEAEGLYGDHENFKYVQAGVNRIIGEDGAFYDVEDINGDLVEECTFYYRREDKQVVFCGGVYLGSPNTEYNPFSHRTNKNKPRYPFAKFGAEPIDAKRFWAYKSLVAKLSNDQESLDREWQMYHDASFLATYPPIAGFGTGKIDISVMVPATYTPFDKGTDIKPINVANPAVMRNALMESERSINDSSINPQLQGADGSSKTKGEAVLLQQNNETNLGLTGRMIGIMVKDLGDLMIDDIIRYQTVGAVSEIVSGIPYMKFRTFNLNNKVKNGKSISEQIKFTDRFAGKKMSKDERKNEEIKMFEAAGDEKHIYEVNASMVAKMEYLITVDYEQLTKRNTAFERAFKLEVFDRALASAQFTGIDIQAVTRDFLLEPLVKGEASKYLKESKVMGGIVPPQTGGKNDMTSRLTKSVAMENAPVV